MRLVDYQRKIFDDFPGLYDRGEDDQVPEGHFSDCKNVYYKPGEVGTRDGISTAIILGYGSGSGKVRRFASFFNPSGIITLVLDDDGNLYINAASTPLITVASATDFSAIQFLGRIYIAFHNGNNGLSGVNLKVFIPSTNEIRDAAGAAPSAGSAMTVVNGAAGSIAIGNHKFAVVYETNTGYLTVPGPDVASVFTPTTLAADGDKEAAISVVPIGPSYVTKRHIIATRANQEEYFFVPDGTIEDNTTTTITVDFFDEDLVDSADYLFDQLETIPAPLNLDTYKARLSLLGEVDNPSIVRYSRPGEPESHDSVDGFVVVSKDDGFECRNSCEVRDVHYIHKTLGNYAIEDNGGLPSEWNVIPIDKTISTPCHGISQYFDIGGIKMARDMYICADKSGLILFLGTYRKPPLTLKINDIWQRLNFDQYHKLVVTVDEQHHIIYVSMAVDDSDENNLFLMGDYSFCPGCIPEAGSIRWAIWEFPFGITHMGLISVVPDTVPTLKLATVETTGKIYRLDPDATSDDGTPIESFIEWGLLTFDEGTICFFNALVMRIIGTGTLQITLTGLDGHVALFTAPNISLSMSPGKDILSRFNLVNERCKVKLLVDGVIS